jgi:hypothetical protein
MAMLLAETYEHVVLKDLLRAAKVNEDVNLWIGRTLAKLGCADVSEVTVSKCKAPVKDDLAAWLKEALSLINRQQDAIKEFSRSTVELKDDFIDSQESIVELQKQVIACKDEQLQLLQKTVTSSVQSVEETVKQELKTFSSAVTAQSQSPTLSPKVLNNVVRQVVEQEDRSRTIMVFGLPEDPNESETDMLDEKVAGVFAAVGEKPRTVEVSRLGKVKTDSAQARPRAVKVTLSCSATVHQLLIKARGLKLNDTYSKVFICPDLSQEQRKERRELVDEQKRLTVEQPNKRHFIRGGRVESVDKT